METFQKKHEYVKNHENYDINQVNPGRSGSILCVAAYTEKLVYRRLV